ncbi:MAG: 23S rRNA (uracil(1939)-C(5))-methyltransferase RlmD [Nanoarchaeota archaeon]|nr:23S rRNA (uracil(1939)-C(5))-methyltransferase RlmD [Nanoarchaeota archaeon]
MNIKDLVKREAKDYARIKAVCKHFNECGGCFFQDISYNNQLEIKKKVLEKLGFEIKGVFPSPKIWYYRNRMDYVCAFNKIGLRKRGTWKEVFHISDCRLLSKESNEILQEIKELAQKYKIDFYDFINHTGYLSYVVIREGKFTNQRMISFVTKSRDKKILKLIQEIDSDSVVWLVNESMSDVSFGELVSHKNKDFILEEFEKVKYIIKPNSFFQTNPFQALNVFKKIKKIVHGSKSVLDLFCGVGAISLFISDGVDDVDGIELSEEAIKCAKNSAKMNDISNVTFNVGDARKLKLEKKYDFVIVDPPRQGLGKKLCKKLNSFDRIVYMSCNPISQKEDLKHLEHNVVEQYAFDMFPHTPHVETLLVLEK